METDVDSWMFWGKEKQFCENYYYYRVALRSTGLSKMLERSILTFQWLQSGKSVWFTCCNWFSNCENLTALMKGCYYSCYNIFPVLFSVRYFMGPVHWWDKLSESFHVKMMQCPVKSKLRLRRRNPYIINRIRRKDTDRKRQIYLLYENNRMDLGNRKQKHFLVLSFSKEIFIFL